MRERNEGLSGVIVAHPGNPLRSYEAVLSMQEAGYLKKYVTGFYYRPNRVVRACIECSRPVRQLVEREFSGRYRPELDASRIRLVPTLELLYIFAHRLKFPKSIIATLWRWRTGWFDRALARILERERPAALICYNDCAIHSLRKAKSLGVFCILDQMIGHVESAVRFFQEESKLQPDFAPSTNQRVVNWVLDRARDEVRLPDLVLAGSNYVKGSLLEVGVAAERIRVLPYGVDTEQFRPAQHRAGKKFRLLFVGLISQRKGIKYLLEAVKQLGLSEIELVMVGRIDGIEQGLAPYRPYFTHIPNLPHAEMHRVFESADAFVFPSLHEGSALVTYEALASGLPVITTENAGSVVRDGVEGFVLPIRDVAALKEKILMLYQSPELRREMGMRARERAEHFTWEAYRTRLRELLGQILAKGSAAMEAPKPPSYTAAAI
jgi:glycosyltransferase involved in cell wall biosynthesis